MPETILSTIPGPSDNERLVIAMQEGDTDRPIVLRQESYSDAVGWFPQSSIELSREQLAGLRGALGMPSARPPRPARLDLKHVEETTPAILSFQAARAVSAVG